MTVDRKTMLGRLSQVMNRSRWYDIRNATGEVAEIRLYGEIGWDLVAEDFAAELGRVTAPEILVAINSPGGEVFDGIAIYNALRAHPARVTTRVDSLAGSVASVISQAGDHRQMMSGSQMAIHEAWGLVIGPAGEMREMADLLDRQSDNLAAIYAERTGKDAAHFRDLMAENEHWMTAEETVTEGLADEVLVPPKQKAKAAVNVTIAETGGDVETFAAAISEAVALAPDPLDSVRSLLDAFAS